MVARTVEPGTARLRQIAVYLHASVQVDGQSITLASRCCADGQTRIWANDGMVEAVCTNHCTRNRVRLALGLKPADLYYGVEPTSPSPNGKGPASSDPAAVEPWPVRRLSDITPEEVPWLWIDRIPLAMLCALIGDPGIGKSMILCAIATALSLGVELGPLGFGVRGLHAPRRTLMLAAEDSPEHTISARLDEMGADRTHIYVVDDRDEWPAFDTDGFSRFDALLRDLQPTLVTIDPLMSYLGGRLDTGKDNETRAILKELRTLAQRHMCAIVYLLHMNKASAYQALYRAMGSIAFVAQARSVLLAGVDPDDSTRSALVHVKGNLGVKPEPIGYQIAGPAGLFAWTGATSLTERAILAGADPDPEARGALDRTMGALREILADGALPTKHVLKELRDGGFSERTIDRAKSKLGVVARRVTTSDAGERQSYWTWRLPLQERQERQERQE